MRSVGQLLPATELLFSVQVQIVPALAAALI